MLQALGEHDVVPDLVVGTSVGSLNGAVVALDPVSAPNRLAHAWTRMTREAVFPGGPLAQARTLQRSGTHLFPNTGLAAVIADFLGDARSFDELALPFGAVTMDIATTRPHVIRTGSLVPALVASCAIPGIYPSVDIGPLRLYDGGVVANVPIRQALEMGARSLVVLDCSFPGHLPDAPHTLADVLLFTMTVTCGRKPPRGAPRRCRRCGRLPPRTGLAPGVPAGVRPHRHVDRARVLGVSSLPRDARGHRCRALRHIGGLSGTPGGSSSRRGDRCGRRSGAR